MLYEVDFAIKTKSNFKTVFSAIVWANTLTECQEEASEIAKEKNLLNTQLYIQELIIPQE